MIPSSILHRPQATRGPQALPAMKPFRSKPTLPPERQVDPASSQRGSLVGCTWQALGCWTWFRRRLAWVSQLQACSMALAPSTSALWWPCQHLAAVLALVSAILVVQPLPARALEPSPAAPASPATASYRCDGDGLLVRYEAGAVDAPDIPNLLAGTAPGAFVVIDWRDQHLQLPRTNNSGVPSYSDGRWWWRALDPQRPEFRQRRGVVISYACEPAA